MKILIVIGHGRSTSLCHHLAGVARGALERAGAEWRQHDLLADGFDPVLRLRAGEQHAMPVSADEDALVARYQKDVRWADAYLISHPVWWFAPPALLKGWVDRVLADGVALSHASEPPVGSLGPRKALVVQTFAAPRAVDRLVMRRLAARFWTTVVFPSVGVRHVTPLALHETHELTEARLRRFERRLTRKLERLVASGS